MASFDFLDSAGMQVACVVHGGNSLGDWLRDGVEILLYFATVQRGRNNRDGAVWIYNSAHVQVLNGNAQAPAKTGTIRIP